MIKQSDIQQEREKLLKIFKDVETSKAELVEGLINDAAFLFAENISLRESMASTGMVKIHPQHPDIQKPTETSKQYLKNINSYAVIIKALNGILSKSGVDEDDELEEFE